MTKLIEVTRAYESHMQAIKTYQEVDARSVNDIARDR
jgi:flagellar basal body rod protein FlgG